MNGKDVLSTAIDTIKTHGLSFERAFDPKTGGHCTAASLIEAASKSGRFQERAYLEARSAFTKVLGIPDSYQSIVDWNDRKKTRDGGQIKTRTVGEVVGIMRRAIKNIDGEEVAVA